MRAMLIVLVGLLFMPPTQIRADDETKRLSDSLATLLSNVAKKSDATPEQA
jgi:hypothetical protein